MGPLVIFLLSLYQLQTATNSAILDGNRSNANTLSDSDNDLDALIPPELETDAGADIDDSIPFVKTGHDQTEVEFRHPISSVNIDYSKNVIILKFRKEKPTMRMRLNHDEEEDRKSLESNFMRFGRSPGDFMRFGKRQLEQLPNDSKYNDKERSERRERSQEGMRDSRGDNFMRFGRSSQDFMRFGRGSSDFMRLGRSPSDFMRLGRSPSDFMRLGRSPSDFMRLGRSPSDFMRLGRSPSDFMRLGRSPSDFMRLGRANSDFMRLGRSPDFMRFGRNQNMRRQQDKNFIRFGRPDNFMRFGRSPSGTSDESENFMRFGKMDQNFMRPSKSLEQQQDKTENHTKPLLQKSVIKEAAKLLQQHEKDPDDSNPMDKAIKVLFGKEKSQDHSEQQRSTEDDTGKSADDETDNFINDNDMNMEMDY